MRFPKLRISHDQLISSKCHVLSVCYSVNSCIYKEELNPDGHPNCCCLVNFVPSSAIICFHWLTCFSYLNLDHVLFVSNLVIRRNWTLMATQAVVVFLTLCHHLLLFAFTSWLVFHIWIWITFFLIQIWLPWLNWWSLHKPELIWEYLFLVISKSVDMLHSMLNTSWIQNWFYYFLFELSFPQKYSSIHFCLLYLNFESSTIFMVFKSNKMFEI